MHKESGPGPFAGEVELKHHHSHVANSVTVKYLLMEGEFTNNHGGVADLRLLTIHLH